MRKLNTYVHVDGVRYGPSDELSAEVAKKITNPDVWAEGSEIPVPVADEPPAPPAETDQDPNRPRGNASREEWATYATGKVEVTGQMNRDDIKAAVDEHLAAKQQGK
jgi:hypothetical protein